MNRVLLAVLAAGCFAAGWRIDAWTGRGKAGEERNGREEKNERTATGRKAGGSVRRGNGGGAGAGAGLSSEAGARVAEGLLGLTERGNSFAEKVRLDEAAAGLSGEELGAAALELWTRAQKDVGQSLADGTMAALVSVMERWMEVDPLASSEFSVTHDVLRHGELAWKFLKPIARVYKEDWRMAAGMMARVDDRELYIFARHECIRGMAGMDPKAALEIIAEFDAETRNQWHGAETLGDFPKLWIEKDAPAAMHWAMGLEPGYTRHRILTVMAGDWKVHDAAAAKAFLSGVSYEVLPPGNLRADVARYLGAEGDGAPAQGKESSQQ